MFDSENGCRYVAANLAIRHSMNGPEESDPEDVLTPAEVARWAQQEIVKTTKAFELRVKEATELVTRYADGHISAEEAKRRIVAFDRRWGEALYGVTDGNVSNDEILATIDAARRGVIRALPRGAIAKGIAETER
jgi:hypothetical protein